MRKKKKQDNRLYCPYCGRQAVLRPATYVYGERNLDPENYLYVCGGYPACDSYIGVHKKSRVLWEPWQMGIFATSGSKHTGR